VYCIVYPPGAFPCLEVVFVVKRDFAYFLMQYYITSALFVVLSWVSFWISVDAIVARVYLGLVTVLTLTMLSVGSQVQTTFKVLSTNYEISTLTHNSDMNHYKKCKNLSCLGS